MRPTDVSSQDALLAELDSQVEELRSNHEGIAAIGFGLPSQIDQPSGRALSSVNIPLADFAFRVPDLLMGSPQQLLEEPELGHQLQGRGMDRVAAKVTQEVSVLLDHGHRHAGAG